MSRSLAMRKRSRIGALQAPDKRASPDHPGAAREIFAKSQFKGQFSEKYTWIFCVDVHKVWGYKIAQPTKCCGSFLSKAPRFRTGIKPVGMSTTGGSAAKKDSRGLIPLARVLIGSGIHP